MRSILMATLLFLSMSIGMAQQQEFSKKGLADTFVNMEGKTVTFSTILEENLGKTVLLDIWASWCKDCIAGMPKVKALMATHPKVAFVYLSLDKTVDKWKSGIDKYKLGKGHHYFAPKGWKSDLFTDIDLDWIPRYMLLDKTGRITIYKAITADDENLLKQLKTQENEK